MLKNSGPMPTATNKAIEITNLSDHLLSTRLSKITFDRPLAPFETASVDLAGLDTTFVVNPDAAQLRSRAAHEWRPIIAIGPIRLLPSRAGSVSISFPAVLGEMGNVRATQKQTSAKIKFDIRNESDISIGTESGRRLAVSLVPLDGSLKSEDFQFSSPQLAPSGTGWQWQIPKIEAHGAQTVSGSFSISGNPELMSERDFRVELQLQKLYSDDLALIGTDNFTFAYEVSDDIVFDYTRDVTKLGLTCSYAKDSAKKISVAKIFAKRVAGSRNVRFHYQLDKWFFSNSPVYSLDLKDLGPYIMNFAKNEKAVHPGNLKKLFDVVQRYNHQADGGCMTVTYRSSPRGSCFRITNGVVLFRTSSCHFIRPSHPWILLAP